MSNWPLPSPDIQCLLRTLPTKSTGHPIGTAAIMSSHIKKCPKTPLDVRTYLLNAHQFQQQKMKMNPTIIQDQQSDILSDESILPVNIYETNKLLLESIIEGGAPLSFVDSTKFREFVHLINIHYHVPTRKQLSNDILNDVYKKVQVSIQKFISKFEWISITTDGWTNIHQDHIINYMVIGKNRQTELVKIKDTFGESQTSTVIFKDLDDILIRIGLEKINAIITDGAANHIRMKVILTQKYSNILALP
ncbi:12403_t:CDS:2, partial [Cetraspora pellucida]